MPTSSRESTRVPIFAILLTVTVALLLAFTWFSVAAQHAAGVYSEGQVLFIQGHTNAIRQLERYAERGNPMRLERAMQSLQIPLAYARARNALEQDPPDVERAVDAFTSTGIAHGDALRAARFFPLFRRVGPVRRTIASWRESDAHFDSLRAYGAALALAHASGDRAAIDGIRVRIDRTDRELTRHERVFATGIADASRMLPPIVLLVGIFLGAALIGGSILTVRSVARAADRARAAEREHYRRLHALMEGVPDLIAWIDREGRYVYVNAAMEQLCGVPRSRLLHLAPHEVATLLGVGEQFVRDWETGLAAAFRGARDVALVVEIPRPSGRAHVYQYRLAEQRDDAGEVESVIAIGRDITALRESEAALRDREVQLRHAQKLEAVGRLAGGVAHEFNNILTAVTGNIELAMLVLPEQDETRRELAAALAAARRAGSLTRQLLMFGRRDAVELRRLEPSRLLAELEPMLQRLAGDRVQVVVKRDPGGPAIMGDAGQLQQILFNLVGNARDAIEGSGTIQIEVSSATTDDLRRGRDLITEPDPAASGPVDRWVTVTVRDTGSGMTPETVERLFEPFFTTKGPGAGSGLGLPVVNGIVTQLGGCIGVQTAPGDGTAVTVAIPEAPVEGGRSAATPEPGAGATPAVAGDGEPPAGGGEVVLLVEDEAPVRAAARRMLEQAGYRVLEAKHAEDALLQWATTPVDIVVTDFMMPGLSGAELLHRLRDMRPQLPALIVSGYTGGSTIDETALGPDTGLLQKPFSRADLLARVRELLDARHH